MTDTTQTTDLVGLISVIEAAGYDWAVGGGNGYYSAAIEKHPTSYIGDHLAFPGARDGRTPYEALFTAAKERGVHQ